MDGGQIPFLVVKNVNLGEFVEQHMDFTRHELDWVFTRPKRSGKGFNIHDNQTTIYFEDSKCGENTVREMLPILSAAFKLPRLTNCQIRCTAIRNMKRAKIDDRTIMEVTRHTRIETLNKYNPLPTNEKKLERSFAILDPKTALEMSLASPAQDNVQESNEFAHTSSAYPARPLARITVTPESETITTDAQVYVNPEKDDSKKDDSKKDDSKNNDSKMDDSKNNDSKMDDSKPMTIREKIKKMYDAGIDHETICIVAKQLQNAKK